MEWDVVEVGRVLRRAKHARASYQIQDNYRALTWLTRSHLGDDVWAPSAPAPPEARLAVQTVQVAHFGESVHKIRHYTFSEVILMI